VDYRPQPIDTTQVQLDPSLIELTEYLARNTHEVWARRRMSQGWSYGPERDDVRNRHPNLVPYEQLSEGDKQVDRDSSMETLRTILALGWRVEPPEGMALATAAPGGQTDDPAGAAKLSLAQVVAMWQLWEHGKAPGWLEDYRRLGARALELGEFLLAFDILKAGLKKWPKDVRLRQLQARALANSGAFDTAVSILRDLRREGHQDEETLGLLGRVYKDVWERETDPRRKARWLALSCKVYEDAYRRYTGYWTGINAATLATILGRDELAASLATAVRRQCQSLLAGREGRDDAGERSYGAADYWPLATLAEAALVLGDENRADELYRQAVAAAGGHFGNIASTRRNARLLLRHRLSDPRQADARMDAMLPLARVVVFSGHMIDQPSRAAPRFPPALEEAVSREIRRRLDDLNVGFGYASGACGADILFHEAVRQRGGEVNVVLPYEVERFVCDSVARPSAPHWEQRFRTILADPATRLSTAGSQGRIEGSGIANEYANTFTFGMAGIRAWQLGAELAALAVWDGRAGDGPGGTADAVARWRARGLTPILINPLELMAREKIELSSAEAGTSCGSASTTLPEPALPRCGPAPEMSGQLMALLFADVAGFSKLREEEIPLFVRHFLDRVGDLARRSAHKPVQRNTWGDGLYFVFRDVNDAAMFALELRDLIAATDWTEKGFRAPLGLRTGLHVGPVYACTNPVTGLPDFIGTHVSRAARLEPVTPKGHVYASEVFAAIAFASGASGFVCEYVGRMGMAKGYGVYPTYHVRRTTRGKRG
jgi:hypothetical protein